MNKDRTPAFGPDPQIPFPFVALSPKTLPFLEKLRL
jgi:hypothetical protein